MHECVAYEVNKKIKRSAYLPAKADSPRRWIYRSDDATSHEQVDTRKSPFPIRQTADGMGVGPAVSSAHERLHKYSSEFPHHASYPIKGPFGFTPERASGPSTPSRFAERKIENYGAR